MTQDELNYQLREMGCSRRGDKYILDGWDSEIYLIFDVSEIPDDLKLKPATCDILIAPVGKSPSSNTVLRLIKDADILGIVRFVDAMGVDRLPDRAQTWYAGLMEEWYSKLYAGALEEWYSKLTKQRK